MDEPLVPSASTGASRPDKGSMRLGLVDRNLFLKKTFVIVLATYAFIPIMYLHDQNDLASWAYATILVSLHVGFICIYFWRVKFRSLDPSWRSLAARVLGLLCCVGLLALVAGQLEPDLGRLAIELLGLCAVHTIILGLLMVKVSYGDAPKEEKGAVGGASAAKTIDDNDDDEKRMNRSTSV